MPAIGGMPSQQPSSSSSSSSSDDEAIVFLQAGRGHHEHLFTPSHNTFGTKMARSRFAKALNFQSGTLCPFLYQTRTLTTSYRLSTAASTKRVPEHEETTLTFLQKKALDVSTRKEPVESTMTLAEREVFENIMRTFGAKIDGISISHQPTSEALPHENDMGLGEHGHLSSAHPREPVAFNPRDTNVDTILSLFAPTEESHRFTAFVGDPSNPSSTSTEDVQDLAGYGQTPAQKIRNAALQSLEHISKNLQTATGAINLSPDLAVWHALEKDVFPLVTLLQSQRFPLSMDPSQRSLSSLPADLLPSSISSAPLDIPLFPLITILYPAATLLALRTYTAHFPASQLALSLLPKIRSLGPVSYLLAANTHFYNTLMYLQWAVYSDVNAINLLLNEMKRNGAEFDQASLNLVEGIIREREQTFTDDQPGNTFRGRDWWQMKRQDDAFRRIMRKWTYDVFKKKEPSSDD